MNALRIAYVVNVFPKLSETFIAHELAELRRQGAEVRVLSLRPPTEELRHEVIRDLAAVIHYDLNSFRSEVARFRPHFFHAHFATEPTAAALSLGAEFGVPVTFTAHGYDIRRKPPADFAARARQARAVVTVSRANADYIVNTFGVESERLRLIPCGVDTNYFSPKKEDEAVENQVPTVVCVARHVKVKNLGLLLTACAKLRDRGVRFRCLSIGDGVCRPELEAQRSALQLEKVVEFLGAKTQAEVLAEWRRAAVAVLSSESEGMPVALMEAGACGVATVATRVGGIPELIDEGVTGMLATPGDADEFAAHLQALLENPALAAHMGAKARRRIVEMFSLAQQGSALRALWSELMP